MKNSEPPAKPTKTQVPSVIPPITHEVTLGCGPLPPELVKEFPGKAQLRVIKGGGPWGSAPEMLSGGQVLDIAGHLWALARGGLKPQFVRAAKRVPGWKNEDLDKAYELACRKRKEALAIFQTFADELLKLWPKRKAA